MVNYPNPTIPATPGSISGFDITLPDGTSLNETNFSISQLLVYIQQMDAFYSPERFRAIEKAMMSHIRDLNNPHKDSIGMLLGNEITGLLQQYMPGTVPRDYPLLSMQAALEDLSNLLSSVTVTSSTELNVVDRQGYLKYVGPGTPCVDWQYGQPLLPCWPAKRQYITQIDLNQNPAVSLINTAISNGQQNGIIPLFISDQILISETATQGQMGLKIASLGTLINGNEYTFSVFFYPQKSFGSYVLQSSPTDYAVIDLLSATVVQNSGTVNGYVNILPNGWWRIGLNFIAQQSINTAITLSYTPKSYTTNPTPFVAADLTYVGVVKTPIMTLYGPQLTDGPGMAPFTQIGQIGATTISMPGFGSALPMLSGQLVTRYRNAASLLPQTVPIITATNDVTLTETTQTTTMGPQRQLTYKVGVTTPSQVLTQTPNSADDLMSTALSYSPQKLIALSKNTTRTTIYGQTLSFQALPAATTFTIGSFNGGIHAIELYAFADDGNTLEFLVG